MSMYSRGLRLRIADSKAFRRMLLERGMSLVGLSEASNVSYPCLGRMMAGYAVRPSTASKIVNTLNVPLGELFEVVEQSEVRNV